MLECKRNTTSEPQFDCHHVDFHRYEKKVVVGENGERSFKVTLSDRPFVQRGFKTSDFSLGSILAAGATNLLSPQFPLAPSVDYVEAVASVSDSNPE